MPKISPHDLPPHMQAQVAKKMTEAEAPPTEAAKHISAEERKAERERWELELAIQLSAESVHGWVREHKFHPDRQWKFDFAFPDSKFAVEVEGGIWRKGGGAHSRPEAIERDIEKYNAALELGWVVYRLTPGMLKAGGVACTIRRLVQSRGGVTKPAPRLSLGKCKHCGREIAWLKTVNDKNIPVDPQGVDPAATIFDREEHTAHFETCPEREK